MSKSKVFLILIASFVAGVFMASFFPPRADANLKSICLLVLAGTVAVLIINYTNKKAWVVSAAILFILLGIWRTDSSVSRAKNKIDGDPSGPSAFSAFVSKEPEADEKIQKIVITDENEKKILINAELFPSYQYGDRLKIGCILQPAKNADNSNFDYQMYLAKEGIYRVCNRPQITLAAKNGGNRIYSFILAVKNNFEEKVSQIFPDPEGAYLKGLIFGGGKRMTKELNDAFSKTGTTHAVAVSGYNVTIVAAFLMWLGIFLGLWRRQVFSFAMIGIVIFVLATGAPASAVRAGIMGSLILWAMKEGRLANSTNAIILAAALMLLINPLLLRYDAGFQLSFLATLGIVWLYPLFEKKFQGSGLVKETILLSVAAQIFVLPILLNSFEKLSLVSPLANLLILPAIPFIMLGGFVAGIAGIIFVPLGQLVGFVPYLLLKIELLTVQWLANLPWSAIEVKNFGWQYVSVYYIILSGLLLFSQIKKAPTSRGLSG